MNKKTIISIIAVIAVIGGLLYWNKMWSESSKNAQVRELENSGDMISSKGIHWHPELKIIIRGEAITIPANIGIGMQYAGRPLYDPMMSMTNMHTHDDSGTLHWEVMQGPVKKDDVRLANFFAIWGKKFDGNCIFESCNGSEGTVKMLVNGKENTEFENYLVNDKDKIEIRYE